VDGRHPRLGLLGLQAQERVGEPVLGLLVARGLQPAPRRRRAGDDGHGGERLDERGAEVVARLQRLVAGQRAVVLDQHDRQQHSSDEQRGEEADESDDELG
jgi:hypothetical protein